jgi:hypothetical protein
MPCPTASVFSTGAWNAAGQLPAGPAVYDVFIRFQDAGGNEGLGVEAQNTVSLGVNPSGQPNNAILVSLPPVFPSRAVAVVPYIRRDDPASVASPVNETDQYGNFRYERLDPILNAERLYIHDIEVRNFAADGFSLQNVNYSQFARIHSHRNGRHGASIVTSQMQEADFDDCVFARHASCGVDLEPIGGKSLRWNRCSFLDSPIGVSMTVILPECRDLEFNTCLFDGNGTHLLHVGPVVQFDIVNLKIKDCRFRNNDRGCIQIGGGEQAS